MKRVSDVSDCDEVPSQRIKSDETVPSVKPWVKPSSAASRLGKLLRSSEAVTNRILFCLTVNDLASLSKTSTLVQAFVLRHILRSLFAKRRLYLLSAVERMHLNNEPSATSWRGTLQDVVGLAQALQTDAAEGGRIQFIKAFVAAVDEEASMDPRAWMIFATPYNKVSEMSSVLLLRCGSFCGRLFGGLDRERLTDLVAAVLAAASTFQRRLSTFSSPQYNLGSCRAAECVVRNYVYYCFWAQVPKGEKGRVLSSALAAFAGSCHKAQARLLYVTFGPVKSVCWEDSHEVFPSVVYTDAALSWPEFESWVMWDDMQSPLTDCSRETTSQLMKPLAEALSALYSHHQSTVANADESWFVRLLGALFKQRGEKWDDRNVATLLLFVSEELRRSYLSLQMLETNDASGILVQMLIASAQFGLPADDMFRLIDHLFGSFQYCLKLTAIEDFWAELTERLQDAAATADANSEGTKYAPLLSFVAKIGSSLMLLAYPGKGADQKGAKTTTASSLAFSAEQ